MTLEPDDDVVTLRWVIHPTLSPTEVWGVADVVLGRIYGELIEPLVREHPDDVRAAVTWRDRAGLSRRMSLNAKSIARSPEVLAAGGAVSLLLSAVPERSPVLPPNDVVLFMGGEELDGTPHADVWGGVDVALFSQQRTAETLVVGAVTGLAGPLRAATGAIAAAWRRPSGPLALGQPELSGHDPIEVRRSAERYVRGPHWGLLLGPAQIGVLGGREAVMAGAASVFHTVVSVGNEEHPVVYLQSSERADPTWVQSREQAAFLEPVTRPPAPPGTRGLEQQMADAIARKIAGRRRTAPSAVFKTLDIEFAEGSDVGTDLGEMIVYGPNDEIVWRSEVDLTRDEAEALARERGWDFSIG